MLFYCEKEDDSCIDRAVIKVDKLSNKIVVYK